MHPHLSLLESFYRRKGQGMLELEEAQEVSFQKRKSAEAWDLEAALPGTRVGPRSLGAGQACSERPSQWVWPVLLSRGDKLAMCADG